jgi:hypothetical protein
MTERKENPGKGGRPPISDLVLRQLDYRWVRFKKSAKNGLRRPIEELFKDFIETQKPWLLSLNIAPASYDVLRNRQTQARAARENKTSVRHPALRRQVLYRRHIAKLMLGV